MPLTPPRAIRSGLAIGLTIGLVTATLAAWPAAPARANSFDNKPKILLHVKPVTTKNQCGSWGNLGDCTQAITRGELVNGNGPFYFVYLLVATGPYRDVNLGGDGQGIAGLQCGISYDGCPNSGVDIFNWNLCATLEFPSGGWPAAFSGNLMTWDSTTRCQKGEVAVAGYFYCGAYSRDRLNITPRPVDNAAKVATCTPDELTLIDYDFGSVTFSFPSGSENGCNPCITACNLTDLRTAAALDPPAAPLATASCRGIRLSFPSLGGCGTWKIYRDGDFLADASGTATGFVDAAPPAGGHCYRLATFRNEQLGPLSDPACATAAGTMEVSGLIPGSGAPGDTVEIDGTGFGSPVPDVSVVSFSGAMAAAVPAELILWSDTRLRCVVPAGATTGAVSITNPCGTVTVGFTPVVVTNLLAAASDAGVTLSWDAADDGSAAGFHVYRETTDAGAARVRLTDAPLAVAAHNRFVDVGLPGPGRYAWVIEAVQRSGGVVPLGRVTLDYAGVGAPPGITAIRPNPARGSSVISYRVNAATWVRLAVFDVQGRRVATLVEGLVAAGRHDITWNGRAATGGTAPPGMYVVRLEGAGVLASAKLILAR